MSEVRVDFVGGTEKLVSHLTELRDGAVGLGEAVTRTNETIRRETQKSVVVAEQLSFAFDETSNSVAELNAEAASPEAKALPQTYDKATTAVNKFGDAAETSLEGASEAAEGVASSTEDATRAQAALSKKAEDSRKSAAKLLVETKGMTLAAKQAAAAAAGISKEFEEARVAAGQLPGEFEPGTQAVVDLRTQLREAVKELRTLAATPGVDPERLNEATQSVARLKEEISDLDERVKTLNPDEKFRGFSRLTQSISGGFGAAQGAVALFGGESEKLNNVLFKLFAVQNALQGLDSLLGGFPDTIKDLAVQYGLMGKSATAAAVAEEGAAVATGATGAAATAATPAVTGLRGAFTKLFAVILANPLIALAAAVVAIGAAMIALADETIDATKEVDDFLEKLQELNEFKMEQRSIQERLKLLQNELALQKSTGDLAAKEAKVQADLAAKTITVRQNQKDAAEAYQESLFRLIDLEDRLVNAGDARRNNAGILQFDDKENADAFRRLQKANTQFFLERERANDEAYALELEGKIAMSQLAEEFNEEEARKNEERNEKFKEFVEERLRLTKELEEKSAQAKLDTADPRERIELERQASEEQLKVLEDALKKANQQVTGSNKLSVEQEQQLANIRLAIQEQYNEDVNQLERDQAATRVSLIADLNERERAQLEIELVARAEQLRAAKSTEEEIERDAAAQRSALITKQSQESIELEQRLLIASVEARTRGKETEVEFERQKQLDILDIKIQAAQASLALIAASGTAEDQARQAELAAIIASLNQERAKLAKPASKPISLYALLGIEVTEEQKAGITNAINQAIGLINQAMAAARAEVDAQIAATDEIIADRERRVDELEAQLDREIELNKLGLANNVDKVRAQIELEEEAVKADKLRRNEQLAERRRLARQQLAIDAVVQGSALITAAAQALKSGAEQGGLYGIVVAIAAIAGMIAFFISISQQAKAISAQNSDASSFGKGGKIEKGKLHSEGGTPIVAERGEWVINRKQSKKYDKVLEAINDDKLSSLENKELRMVLDDAGIEMNPETTNEFVEQRREVLNMTTVNEMRTDALERKVDQMTDELRGVRSDMKSASRRTIYPDGTVMDEKPGQTIVTRPRS